MHTMGEYRDSNAVHRADGLRGLVTKTTGRSSPKGQAMRIYRRLPTIQSGIATKGRKLWLFAASTLASAFLGVSEPALAQFGPGSSGNINVGGNPDQTINLTLQGPLTVTSTGGNAVNAANTTNNTTPPSAPVTITADGTTGPIVINNTNNSGGMNQTGLRIQSSGAATITATNTSIDLNGISGNNGIWAIVQGLNAPPEPPVNATVTWNGDHIINNTSNGSNSTGIQAENRGSGNAIVDASGNISVSVGAPGNFTLLGIKAGTGSTVTPGSGGVGDAMVTYHSGTINVVGASFSDGIFASATGGSATVTASSGTSIIVSQAFSTDIAQVGIEAFASTNGATTVTAASTITVNGNGNPMADFRSQPRGIMLQSNLGGAATVTYSGPGITVYGGGGIGIVAVSGSSNNTTASGSVTVDASRATGPINADGSNAIGILADSGTLRNAVRGLPTTLMTGPVEVTASNVSTQGEFGTAISATGGSGGVTVNIPSGGMIMGGWQPDVTSVGVTSGRSSAGVILGSSVGTATLINNGSIGALSDRAVANPLPSFFATPANPSPFPTSNNTSIINNGTITGFVQLVGSNNSIVNNGVFDLRHFADTTGAVDASGNGVRDTVRVAVSDLGPGTFTNNGTLALPAVSGATKLDSTGQYLPLGQASSTMALNGPLQGQLIGVATFTNSGTIDLWANPVPGDVLMITGGRGGSTPGTGGGGTFISNGGLLKLDTVLNEGGPATISDTLVVDGTLVGPAGATSIAIRNAGGTGALTVGDGILVVQVLDPARSADGAFTLLANQELRAGDFDYRLFHGGIGGSNPADWFLRNEFVVPGGPPVVPQGETETKLPPNPPQRPLPPGVYPIIGPEIATYGVVQPLARQLGLAILGTLDDRVGDTYEPESGVVAPAPATIPSGISKEGGKEVVAPPPPVAAAPRPLFAPSVWSRFFAQSVDTHYRAFADPSASGNLWGFQLGVDLLRGSLFAGHYERAGLYGAYGSVNSDVHGLVANPEATAYILGRTGSLSLDALSAGGYWTHVGPGGWYLDAVVQGTWYFGSASTQFANLSLSDSSGFIASLEGGAPFSWPQSWPQLGPGFVIEPQGQILWQKVSFSDKNDGLGEVALGDTTGPSGRIGLRTKWTIATAGGQVWQPYLRANLWRDWGAEAHTVFSGTDVAPLASQANWLELGGGLTVRINANVSVYANADYEFAVGNTDDNERNGVRGAFGARYTW